MSFSGDSDSSSYSTSSPMVSDFTLPTEHHHPVLIQEYLSYLSFAEVQRVSEVCRSWVRPSRKITLRTFCLADRGQRETIRCNPDFGCLVQTIIIPSHSYLAVSIDEFRELLPYLVNIQTLQFFSPFPDSQMGIRTFIQLLLDLPRTLKTIVLTDRMKISYESFSQLLATLGQLDNLCNLTLPSPYPPDDESESEVSNSFRLLSPRLLRRPGLSKLQLVPVLERNNPKPVTSAFKGVQDYEWEWVENALCPFDLSNLQQLVVGSPNIAQRLLLMTHNTLTHLEFSVPLNTRSSWERYDEMFKRKIHLPRLTFLQVTTHSWLASWLLDIITTPRVEEVAIKWTSGVSPLYYEVMFQHFDKRIAKLGVALLYPQHLNSIRLIGPTHGSDKPDLQWYKMAFSSAIAEGVEISVDYVDVVYHVKYEESRWSEKPSGSWRHRFSNSMW